MKNIGVPVEAVLDVGVQKETKELIECFPDAKHLLFEPVVDFNDDIRRNYEGLDYDLFNVAVSDSDGESGLKLSSICPHRRVTHANLVDEMEGEGVETTRTRRLDTVVIESGLPGPFLLKVDVDGAEMKVMRGASATLKMCSAVVVEAHPRDFFERCEFLIGKDFYLFDIVDFCYYENTMKQFDLIFANKNFVKQQGIVNFDFSKWEKFDR